MVYKLFSEGFEGRLGRRAHREGVDVSSFCIQSESLLARSLMNLVKILLVVFDILSYPIYFVLQRPGSRGTCNSQSIISKLDGSSSKSSKSAGEPATINEIFAQSISKHSNESCLGYRAVVTCPVFALNEEGKHVLQNKSFRSDYTWYTYEQIGRRVQDIASGLRHCSIEPGSRALFLANTCLEWFIAAQACFQAALQLVVAPEITSPLSLATIIERSDVEIIFASCDRIELLCRLFDEIKRKLIGPVKTKKIILIDWQFSVDFSEPLFAGLRDSCRHIIEQILSMGQIEETGVENPIEPSSCTRRTLNLSASGRSTPCAASGNRIGGSSSQVELGHVSRQSEPPVRKRAAPTGAHGGRTESPNLDSWCFVPRASYSYGDGDGDDDDNLLLSSTRHDRPGSPKAADVAMIVFSHGSLGVLKGILIDHAYLAKNSLRLLAAGIIRANEVYCSILPLDNLSELMTELAVFSCGGSIGYSCSLETLFRDGKDLFKKDLSDMEALRPSLTLVRPYILERLKSSTKNYLALQMNPIKSFLLRRVLYEYKRYWTRLNFGTPIIDRLFCTDVLELFGGQLKRIMCDGLTDCSDTKDFFELIVNVPIREVHGAEEAPMSLISAPNIGHREQIDSRHLRLLSSPILRPTLGVKLKLEAWEDFRPNTGEPCPSGRLLIGGDVVCTGYFGSLAQRESELFDDDDDDDDDETDRTAPVRWFRTNYIARLFPSGCIGIISTISNLIKMSDGQFISLSQIEHILRNSQFVDNVCAICGEDRNFIIALVVPNLRRLALKSPGEANLKMAIGTETEPEELTDTDFRREVCNDRLLCEFVSEHLGRLFGEAGLGSLPSKFHIVPEIWTPETELVTPSFEPKRAAIQRFYAADIQSLFRLRLSRTNVRLSARLAKSTLGGKLFNSTGRLAAAAAAAAAPSDNSPNGARMSY